VGEGLSPGLAADGLADDVGVGLGLAEALADGVSIGRVESAVLEFVAECFGGRFLVAGLSQRCGEDVGGGGRFFVLVFVAGGFGDDAGLVVLSSSGQADVEVFGRWWPGRPRGRPGRWSRLGLLRTVTA
jgi:hypothetical protein